MKTRILTVAGILAALTLGLGLPPATPASANAGTIKAPAKQKDQLIASVLVRGNGGRGDNFKLDVSEGEEIRFEVDSAAVRKKKPSFWMNRDKQGFFGAEDKRIYSNLKHGHVRTVQNFSSKSGVRMYIKSNYKHDFYVNIYRVRK